MMRLVLIALGCLTIFQIREIECNVACVREGFSGGKYQKEACQCQQTFPYKKLTGPKINSPIFLEHTYEPPPQGPIFRIDEHWNFE